MLSVVIPTLNEAARIGPRLDAIAAAEVVGEVIVSDGGSADGTREIASRKGVRILGGPAGRGAQMAAGAVAATGNWLLFLHADTEPGPGWATVVKRFMADPDNRYRAGYFRFALDDPAPAARRLEWLVRQRCRLLSLPYGDQGLLISADYYERLGGFQPIPLMEDVALVRRMPRHRLVELPAVAITSAVRYQQGGYIARPARNLLCLVLYFLGMPPSALVDLYR